MPPQGEMASKLDRWLSRADAKPEAPSPANGKVLS